MDDTTPVRAGGPLSHWLATAHRPQYPRLDRDLDVDTVVIGGGIAGLATARELAVAGRETVLIEADRILSGTTGHTTGKLTALHGLQYERLRRSVGPDGAGLYAAAQQDALERAVALGADPATAPGCERLPALTYVRDPERVGEIRAEVTAARAAGLDARVVTETGLPFAVAAAVYLPDQLQIHPVAFLTGLAEAVTAAGGRIFEQTRATAVEEHARIRIETSAGPVVHAAEAVLACHYPLVGPVSLLARLSPRRELVIAAPVPENTDPHGMYLTPEDRVRSVRTAPYAPGQRLLIVAGESFRPGENGSVDRWARLESWARESFPGFGTAGGVQRWAAQDVDSADHLPFVGHLHPGTQHLYVATGFGGWGLTGGIMAGRLLTAHIRGGPRPAWTELFDPRRMPPARELPSLLTGQAAVAGHYLGDRRHLAGREAAEALEPGEGAVIRVHGHPCAVHRDTEGTLRAVAARCTHMGCLVAFNQAEQTWECPCHGSRFAPDGTVLDGPAATPLAPREL
ncbi:FAD-dependent oxidoreductase [Streptomyces venezuelae]|uniref:FAD-dependent oxidoreductase n=1 Tax=Streptomyces venezuelae TaxID=54571 RepID=A0A5P2DB27_STRVZ|nr:FAD-dependent oxidoreductase [Streptomyces venezuelae]QES51308.1 FAD-dependent oxidoreductase [Streptomyces venezuelae]